MRKRFGKLDCLAAFLMLYYLVSGLYFLYMKPVKTMVGAFLVMLGMAGLSWFVIRRHKDDSTFVAHRVFPVVLLVNCMLYAVFFTPFTVPDEEYHFHHSYAYANILTLGPGDRFQMRLED